MSNLTPFHAEERHVQAIAGQVARADNSGRMIANTIMAGAWTFLEEQSMLVLGSWNGQRDVCASLMVGQPGFVRTVDGSQVIMDTAASLVGLDDPLWENAKNNGRVSLLAIELTTRRRLRINGQVVALPNGANERSRLEIKVEQAYPNCPKYIQRRVLRAGTLVPSTFAPRLFTQLSDEHVQLISNADTFFVASVHSSAGTDVSHRGGKPGFVNVVSSRQLRIPDYVGNGMFNTLGNIHASGIAGLLFIDFTGRRQLQIIGDARIDWASQTPSAQRYWSVDVRQVRESWLPEGLTWTYVDASPFNPFL